MNLFERQCKFEDEGAAAGLDGKTREDCPYDEESQSLEWNFWVYGCENAQAEKATLERGTVKMMQVGASPKYEVLAEWEETTERAYKAGHWRPRYVTVPAEWLAPISR